jgi:hypothetical protein
MPGAHQRQVLVATRSLSLLPIEAFHVNRRLKNRESQDPWKPTYRIRRSCSVFFLDISE